MKMSIGPPNCRRQFGKEEKHLCKSDVFLKEKRNGKEMF